MESVSPKNLIPFSGLDSEVQKLIGRSWSTMTYRRWIKEGVRGRVLPSRLIGGIRYIFKEDLVQFLNIESDNPRLTVRDQIAVRESRVNEPRPFDLLKESLKEDSDFAWVWHMSLVFLIIRVGGGVGHKQANLYAAEYMEREFEVDVTQSDEWTSLEMNWVEV